MDVDDQPDGHEDLFGDISSEGQVEIVSDIAPRPTGKNKGKNPARQPSPAPISTWVTRSQANPALEISTEPPKYRKTRLERYGPSGLPSPPPTECYDSVTSLARVLPKRGNLLSPLVTKHEVNRQSPRLRLDWFTAALQGSMR